MKKIFIISLLAILLSFNIAYAALSQDVQAYYKLDGDYTDSVNSYDGTAIGTDSIDGKIGTGYYFKGEDGDPDAINITSFKNNNLTHQLTISVWFRPNESVAQQRDFARLAGKLRTTNKAGFIFTYGSTNAGLGVTVYNNDNVYAINKYAVDLSNWNHIVWAYDYPNRNSSLYINGQLVNSTELQDLEYIEDSDEALMLGARAAWGSSTNAFAINGTLDEIGIWNRTLTDIEIIDLYNNGVGSSYDFSPQFKITATNYIYGETIYNFNATINNTLFQTTNGTIVTNLLHTDTSLKNITIIGKNTIARTYIDRNISSDLSAVLTRKYRLNISAWGDFATGQVLTYSVNASSINSTDTIKETTTNGSLIYSLIPNETYKLTFSATDYAPLILNITMDSSWKATNQTLYLIDLTGIFTCNTTFDITTLNFTIFDEDYKDNRLDASVDGVVEITDYAGIHKNQTFNYTSTNNFTLCIYPEDYTFYTDIYIEYDVPDGRKERYYLDNISLNNVTNQINLFNFNTTATNSILIGTILDENSYQAFPDVIAKLQRYYPDENLWRQVQVDKSDEFGQVYFYVKERETRYKIFFEKDNIQLDNTAAISFQCDTVTGLCEVTFRVPQADSGTKIPEIDFNIEYDNNTDIVTVYWNDPTGYTQSVRVAITTETPFGVTTWYNQTASAASGSMDFNVSNIDGTIKVTAYNSASPEVSRAVKYIQKLTRKLYEVVASNNAIANGKNEVAIWALGFLVTMIGAALWSIFAVIFTFFIGMVMLYFFAAFSWLTLGILGLLGVMIIIISMKLKS